MLAGARSLAAIREWAADAPAEVLTARRVGDNVKTVRRYARADNPEQLIGPNTPTGRDVLGTFKPHLRARLAKDPTVGNATLLEEIRARGYRGSLRTLREYLAGLRRQASTCRPGGAVAAIGAAASGLSGGTSGALTNVYPEGYLADFRAE